MNLLDIFLEKTKMPSIAVSILPEVAKQAILQNQLPRLNTNNIFLNSGEYCCYIDKTILLIDKTKKYINIKAEVHQVFLKERE